MSYSYTYTIATDIPAGKVNIQDLEDDIVASTIATALSGISTEGGAIADGVVTGGTMEVTFAAQLSAGDKTTLDGDTTAPAGGIIGAQQGNPTPQPPGAGTYVVVRQDGSGDYTTVSAALASGAKSIFVSAGTYVETGALDMPEDCALMGESPGAVVIVPAAGQSLNFSGAGRRITAGTITATNGSTTVTGVGTDFTGVQAEDFLKIGSAWHKIIGVTDATNLELETAYRGATYNGSFVAQSMATGANLQNLIVANAASHGICLEQAFHVSIQNTLVIACGGNGTAASCIIKECSEVHAIGFVVENAGADGIHVANGTLIRLETNAIKNSVGDGFSIVTSEDVSIDAAMAIQNGGVGINIDVASVRTGMSECIVNRNASHGVVLGADCVVEGGSFFANGGDGIVVPAVANAMIGDARSTANGGAGVNVQAGATDAIVTACNLLGNTGTNLIDNGTATTAASNKS